MSTFNQPRSRRTFLRQMGLGAAALGVGVSVAGCSSKGSTTAKTGGLGASSPVTGTVRWAANSGEIDPKDVKRFEAAAGVTLDYREVIADADQFFASVKPQLTAGLSIGYDLICLSSQYVSVYAEHDWLIKPDSSALPNVTKNLLPQLSSVAHRDIAIPYDYAPLGLAYSKKDFPSGLHSWGDLLSKAAHGKVGLYSTPIPNVAAWGLYLKSQGKIDHAPAEMTIEEALEVVAFLKPYIRSGQLLTTQGENAVQKLASGDLFAAVAPPVNVAEVDPVTVGFAVPTEGAPAYVDRLAIPKGAANPRAAEALIDWWFQPENAASFCKYTLQYPYARGVKDVLAKTDPKLADNPIIFPGEDVLNRLFPYPPPWSDNERASLSRAWTAVISG